MYFLRRAWLRTTQRQQQLHHINILLGFGTYIAQSCLLIETLSVQYLYDTDIAFSITFAGEINRVTCGLFRLRARLQFCCAMIKCVECVGHLLKGNQHRLLIVGSARTHGINRSTIRRILVTTPNPFAPRLRQKRGERGTRYVMANLEHTRWLSVSTMHELAHRAGLEITGLRWPLLKKPRKGFAGQISMAAKRALLAVAPLETVFAEYAFELAIPAKTGSPAAA